MSGGREDVTRVLAQHRDQIAEWLCDHGTATLYSKNAYLDRADRLIDDVLADALASLSDERLAQAEHGPECQRCKSLGDVHLSLCVYEQLFERLAQARQDALNEAADEFDATPYDISVKHHVRRWLRDRAEQDTPDQANT